ncbi:MAG: Ig-like domain-containing protein, partial [Coriobacteriales bacterium]|nr:Ig-like domain-containing protein [Coriobacteriales bacterium]
FNPQGSGSWIGGPILTRVGTSNVFSGTCTLPQHIFDGNYCAYVSATNIYGISSAGAYFDDALTIQAGYINVTGISLKAATSLQVGKAETLVPTISPADADNKAVTWSSSNAAVASVDATGKVTARAAGTATITATTVDGLKTARCVVTVSAALLAPTKAQYTYSLASKPYTGKGISVAVTPKAGAGSVTAIYYTGVSGTKYTKSKTAPKAIGSYAVTVDVAAGSQFNSAKNLNLGTFKIVPKKNSIKSITAGSKQMKVTWAKVSKAQKVTKYQVRYRIAGTNKWKTKTFAASKGSATIKKLKTNSKYQVQVRSYKTVGSVKYYSAWSKTKTSKKIK